MIKILITGGSGFIGTNLLEFYLSKGSELLNIDIVPPRNPKHVGYWKHIDMLNQGQLKSAIHEFLPTHIIHMGARTDLDGRTLGDYAVNIQGVQNLVDAISGLHSLQRIMFASSRLVCKIGYQPKDEFDSCPTTIYGKSKVLGEEIVRKAGSIPCPWIIIRPTSIWGPWFDIPYKSFFLAIARGRYIHPGNRRVRKSFGFVGNTVYELHELMTGSAEAIHGKTLYVADYQPIEIHDFANRIQEAIGTARIKSMPVLFFKTLASGGDFLKRAGWNNPPLTTFRLDNLLTEMIYDLQPLETIAGKLPFSLETGIAMTVDWLRQQGEIGGSAA